MNKHKKRNKPMVIIMLILLVTFLIWSYCFPLQRFLAEKKYQEYSMAQGVSSTDIGSKKTYKDYKQGGYFVSVQYQSDPSHRYLYQYFLVDDRKSGIQFDVMYCKVYDQMNHQLDDYSEVVYHPLE